MARSKKGSNLIPLIVLAGAGALVYFSGRSGDKDAVKKSATRPAGARPPPGPRPQTLTPPPKVSKSSPPPSTSGSPVDKSGLSSLGYDVQSDLSQAIVRFQTDYNVFKNASTIAADGKWGDETSGALESVLSQFSNEQEWSNALIPFDPSVFLLNLGYGTNATITDSDIEQFQIDYQAYWAERARDTSDGNIDEWSPEWKNSLGWAHENYGPQSSAEYSWLDDVYWFSEGQYEVAEEYDPSQGWKIFADYDDGFRGGVHDHLRIGRADWYKDPIIEAKKQKGQDVIQNMEWEDLNQLVAIASDWLGAGMDGDPWHDQDTAALPGGVTLGNLLTGRKNWISGDKEDTVDHFHPALVYSGHIMELVRTGTTTIQSKRGQEIHDKGAEEWHTHGIVMKYTPNSGAVA